MMTAAREAADKLALKRGRQLERERQLTRMLGAELQRRSAGQSILFANLLLLFIFRLSFQRYFKILF